MIETFVIILSLLVALEHFYIMYLESFATSSQRTAKTFGLTSEQLQDKTIITLLKNQGIYNGLLALLLIVAAYVGDMLWIRLLLGYVVGVAIYGGLTSSFSIIWKQGGLAILTLLLSFFVEV